MFITTNLQKAGPLSKISELYTLLLLCLLFNSGCDLKLYELPPDVEKVSVTKGQLADPEVSEVYEGLRPKPEIDEGKEGRHIRRDLQEYITLEWKDASVKLEEDLPKGMQFPDEFKKRIVYYPNEKLLIFKGTMSEEEEDKLLKLLPQSESYKKAVELLYKRSHKSEGDNFKEYVKKHELEEKLFASGEKGQDGFLVRENILAHYDPGISIPASPRVSPGPKLSFIHLSDVQLHDERVYMFSKELTSFFDKFVQSFKHKPGMVLYDHSYYLTFIGTIDLLCERLQQEGKLEPSFMIHTGDAIDMGVVSELFEFIFITNHLTIPWFNVLGNHDYPVYGNINSKEIGVIRPDMGFQTVNSRYNFINMHGKGYDVDKSVYFSPDNAPHGVTSGAKWSVYNGFDFMKGVPKEFVGEREEKPCENCPGYYYFVALDPNKNSEKLGILCVVLDTTTKNFKFAEGTVYRDEEVEPPDEGKRLEQINWLQGILEDRSQRDKEKWMVLVFGHHPLDAFSDDSNKELEKRLLNPRYNVVAYFCGHTHKHEVQVKYHENPENPKTFGFWEIITDSVFEYPKRGSLVTINYHTEEGKEEGKWEITLQSFWPYFLEHLEINTPLKNLPPEVKFPDSLKDKIHYDANNKLLIFRGVMLKEEKDELLGLSADKAYREAVKELFEQPPELIKNAKRCLDASEKDDEGKNLVKRFHELGRKHYDAVLEFTYPKTR
ncbi:MAG TPA: metallophosphoesterase [Candidatus Hypogeohydataceae bacterium YC41]